MSSDILARPSHAGRPDDKTTLTGAKRVKLVVPKSGTNTASSTSNAERKHAFLTQYAETSRFRLGIPKMFKFVPDGSSVLFLRSTPRSPVHDLYEFDIATGKERVVLTADQILQGHEEKLSEEERLRRERLRLSARGITSFQLSVCGEILLVPLTGKLFAILRQRSDNGVVVVRELTSCAGGSEFRYSPDGTMIAFVRDSMVFVISAPTVARLQSGTMYDATPLQVSPTPTTPSISYGTAEYVAQEEMDRFAGFWWSPVSRAIVFQETDTAGMESLTLSDPGQPTAGFSEMPYPRAGTKNARVRLALATLKMSDETRDAVPVSVTLQGWFDPTQLTTTHPRLESSAQSMTNGSSAEEIPFEYIVTVRWIDASAFFVVLQTRCQRVLRLIEISLSPSGSDTPTSGQPQLSRNASHSSQGSAPSSAGGSPLTVCATSIAGRLREVPMPQAIVASSHQSCTGPLLLRELLEERDMAWTGIDQTVPVVIERGSRFLWSSSVSGCLTLQIRSRRTGAVQAVLTDNLVAYRGVVHVDVARGVAFVRGGPNSSEEHIFGVPLPRPSASTALSSTVSVLSATQSASGVATRVTESPRTATAGVPTTVVELQGLPSLLDSTPGSTSPMVHATSSGGCPGSPSFNPADAPKRSFTVPPAFLLTRGSGLHLAVFCQRARQALYVHVHERPFAIPRVQIRAWDFPGTVFQPAITHMEILSAPSPALMLSAGGLHPSPSLSTVTAMADSKNSSGSTTTSSHSADSGFFSLTGPREGVFNAPPDVFYQVEDEQDGASQVGKPPLSLCPVSSYFKELSGQDSTHPENSPYLYFAVSQIGTIDVHSEQPLVRRPYELTSITLPCGRKLHSFICYPPGFFPQASEEDAESALGFSYSRATNDNMGVDADDSKTTTKFPVIVYVYGGPGFRVVSASTLNYSLAQFLASQGFVVISVDGRGTPYRGAHWEREVRYDLAKGPIEDQAEAVRAICTLPPLVDRVDLNNVGIFGWSFGGYLSALAGMLRPDVFKACVAGAPVTDWSLYDTHYTERFLGVPPPSDADTTQSGNELHRLDEDEARKAYDLSSVLVYADKLNAKLMLTHGTSDENVVFGHSLVLSDRLFKLGKDHDFLPLLSQTHMVAKPLYVYQLYSHIVAHFERHLK